MSADKTTDQIIEAALGHLRALGKQPAEIERAATMLRTMASQNPTACRVDLGNGLVVNLPGTPGARGFRQGGRIDNATRH